MHDPMPAAIFISVLCPKIHFNPLQILHHLCHIMAPFSSTALSWLLFSPLLTRLKQVHYFIMPRKPLSYVLLFLNWATCKHLPLFKWTTNAWPVLSTIPSANAIQKPWICAFTGCATVSPRGIFMFTGVMAVTILPIILPNTTRPLIIASCAHATCLSSTIPLLFLARVC